MPQQAWPRSGGLPPRLDWKKYDVMRSVSNSVLSPRRFKAVVFAGGRLGDSIRVEEVGGAELAEFIQGRLPGGRDGLRFFAFLDRLQDRA